MNETTPIQIGAAINPVTTKPTVARVMFANVCLLLALLLATPAHAKRIAMVVGNAAYTEKPLTNPVNDAELMQRTLQGLGFEVSLLRNASRRELLSGLRDFEAKAADAEVALFYFAGHGTQVAGNNYLIPLQAQIRAESDVPDEAVDAGSVLRRMENARAKVGLVVLDACRDNPYAGVSRSSARGLGRMSVPTGSIVAYATAPGSTADDGKGRNGVYTEQLAKHLSTQGLDLREVFDRTAMEVERLTGGKQKPREDIGLRGRLVLKPGAPTQVASVVPEPVVPLVPVPSPGQVSSTSLEDLQREEAARKEWAQWQARMKADFDKTAAFNGSPDLQAKAWERFLANWGQDNPVSRDDETLRSQAQARLQQAQKQSVAQSVAPELTRINVDSSGQIFNISHRMEGNRPVLIKSVKLTNTKTEILFEIERPVNGVCWQITGVDAPYIEIKQKRLKMLDGENITVCNKRRNYAGGERFMLSFEPLPDGIKTFDLIEGKSGASRAPGYWNFIGVNLNP